MTSSEPQNVAGRVYEDFEPPTEWARELGCDTLIAYLQGFSKEDIKVHITSDDKLRISGEHKLTVGENKWRRFKKEFQFPSNCEINGISARYEGSILYVRFPKTIIPVIEEPVQEQKQTKGEAVKTPSESPATEKHSKGELARPDQKNGNEIASKTGTNKRESSGYNGSSREGEKEKEQRNVKTKSRVEAETDNKVSEMVKEKKNDGVVNEEQVMTEKEKHESNDNRGFDKKEESNKKEEKNERENYGKGKILRPEIRYKQVVGNFVMELKKPRNLAILMAVLVLFMITKFFGKSDE